jgi:hypothetical protein
MVADRPILDIPVARILAEENLPNPTLFEGSTPEISFMKEMLLIHDRRLVEDSKNIALAISRQDNFVMAFEHFIDDHWLPLQQSFLLSLHRECPCGRTSFTFCSCGRPRIAVSQLTYGEYFPPPTTPSGPPHTHYSPSTDSSPFVTPEEGEPISIPYRSTGPTDAEALLLWATLYPEQSNSAGKDEGDDGVSGGSGGGGFEAGGEGVSSSDSER